MKSLGVVIVVICLFIQTLNKRTILIESLSGIPYSTDHFSAATNFIEAGGDARPQLEKHATLGTEHKDKNPERSYKSHSSEVTANYTVQALSTKTSYPPLHHTSHFSSYTERAYTSPHFSLFHPPSHS